MADNTTGPAGRRILLLAAHAHDEFAIAVTLRRHVRTGDAVWCAWFAHDDRQEVELLRRAESERAMQRVGVPPERMLFANLPAIALATQLVELVGRVGEIIEDVGPHLIYCPAYEGGHPDHDSLNFAASESVARRGVECWEYPIYRKAEARRFLRRIPTFARMLPGMSEPEITRLTRREVVFKRNLWKVYKTQRPIFDMLLRLSGDGDRYFTTEQSRLLPLRDYSKPPHDRPLLYEERVDPHYGFEEFSDAVRHYRWHEHGDDPEA